MDLDAYFGEFTRRDWETTEPDPVRFAVVGLGGFTRGNILPAIAESDYCAVGATVSGDAGKADAVAAEYDAAALTYEEYADGEDEDAYDAVYVVTPNALHLPHVETAAATGKDVLCEKPLEATAERARALVETCEDAGVTLMTASRLQTEPAIRRAREIVADGLVGDVVHAHGEFAFQLVGPGGDADQWRLDADLAGGGALYDIGIYPLNTTRFLTGATPVAVSARVHSPDAAFEAVDEHVAYQVEFDDDAVGAFTTSYNLPYRQSLDLAGTEGRLAIESPYHAEDHRELVLERGDERVRFQGPEVNELAEQVDYFAHAVHTGTTPEPDGADGLLDVRTLEAILTAAEDGRRVEL
jgi:xylose dehydrogenase (NAD/NADP)